MTGARLGALALLVPDYDAAIFFFVSVMGFRLTADIDQGHKRWVTVEPPGEGVALVLAGRNRQTGRRPGLPVSGDG